MGQKIHPYGLRLGIIKPWQSRWYSKDKYKEYLLEDDRIREFILEYFRKKTKRPTNPRERSNDPALSRIEIERTADRVLVKLYTARPGVVIGQRGRDIGDLQDKLNKFFKRDIRVTVEEVRQPNLDAQLVAENVAQQIERRVAFRRVMRQAVQRTMRDGAEGIRLLCSGRLAGAEIARHERVRDGKVPLHTLRADIDYGFAEASTTYGNIGVKCWVYKGDVIGDGEEPVATTPREHKPRPRGHRGNNRRRGGR